MVFERDAMLEVIQRGTCSTRSPQGVLYGCSSDFENRCTTVPCDPDGRVWRRRVPGRTSNPISTNAGQRHRAALGVSEETLLSCWGVEERGEISSCSTAHGARRRCLFVARALQACCSGASAQEAQGASPSATAFLACLPPRTVLPPRWWCRKPASACARDKHDPSHALPAPAQDVARERRLKLFHDCLHRLFTVVHGSEAGNVAVRARGGRVPSEASNKVLVARSPTR